MEVTAMDLWRCLFSYFKGFLPSCFSTTFSLSLYGVYKFADSVSLIKPFWVSIKEGFTKLLGIIVTFRIF